MLGNCNFYKTKIEGYFNKTSLISIILLFIYLFLLFIGLYDPFILFCIPFVRFIDTIYMLFYTICLFSNTFYFLINKDAPYKYGLNHN